jgi:hypothetical protein
LYQRGQSPLFRATERGSEEGDANDGIVDGAVRRMGAILTGGLERL